MDGGITAMNARASTKCIDTYFECSVKQFTHECISTCFYFNMHVFNTLYSNEVSPCEFPFQSPILIEVDVKIFPSMI